MCVISTRMVYNSHGLSRHGGKVVRSDTVRPDCFDRVGIICRFQKQETWFVYRVALAQTGTGWWIMRLISETRMRAPGYNIPNVIRSRRVVIGRDSLCHHQSSPGVRTIQILIFTGIFPIMPGRLAWASSSVNSIYHLQMLSPNSQTAPDSAIGVVFPGSIEITRVRPVRYLLKHISMVREYNAQRFPSSSVINYLIRGTSKISRFLPISLISVTSNPHYLRHGASKKSSAYSSIAVSCIFMSDRSRSVKS